MAVQNRLAKTTSKQTLSNYLTGEGVKKKINEMVGGKWQPSKEGLGLGKVLDYINVRYK